MSTKKIVLIVVAVVSVLALLTAIFVGGIVGFAFYQIGNSQAAAKARDFLRTNEKLKADIGEVKDFGRIVSGNMQVVDNNGEATVNLKVIGARHTVDASVNLIYTNGSAWRVSAASYVNSAGETIDLLDPYDAKLPVPVLIA